MTEEHLQAVSARIAQLQPHDLPLALQGLLKQAETALKPASKSQDRARRVATPAPHKRALVAAIVLLLERASTALEPGSAEHQAVRGALLAAFQQHAWLWERLLRLHCGEVLGAPAAAGLITEVLLQLGGPATARALGLLRLQLPPPGEGGQTAAALLAILAAAFARLKHCFPVVSFSLPESLAGSQLGPASQPPLEGATRVDVVLSEELPALLHLVLVLACRQRGAGAGGGGACAAGEQAAQQSRGSCSSSVAQWLEQRDGSGKGQRRCARASTGVAASAPPDAESRTGGNAAAAVAAEAAAVKDGALRYAMLLLERLSEPAALHDMLALTQLQPSVTAVGAEPGPAAHAGSSGGRRMSEAEAARVQVAQHSMEVLVDALLTLPAVAAAALEQRQRQGSRVGDPAPPPQQQQQQQQQRGAGEWPADGRGQHQRGELVGGNAGVEPIVAVPLALHRGLAQLRLACGADAEGRSRRGQLPHLSLEGCMRLLRLAASKQQALAGRAARQREEELICYRTDGKAPLGSSGPPPVQLLLPPAVVAHLLDLIGRTLEAGASLPQQHQHQHGPAAAAATPTPAATAGCEVEIAEVVLEMEQACYQGLMLLQQGLRADPVLRGPLHRECLAAALQLHTVLTQQPAAGAAAAQSSDTWGMWPEEEGLGGEGGHMRRRSMARKRGRLSLSEAVLAGTTQPSPKRSKAAGAGAAAEAEAGAAQQRGPAGPGAAEQPGGPGGPEAATNPVAQLLLLFQTQQQQQPAATPGGPLASLKGTAGGAAAAQPAEGASGERPARRRLVPQQLPQHFQQGAAAAAPARKRVTPVAVAQADSAAAAELGGPAASLARPVAAAAAAAVCLSEGPASRARRGPRSAAAEQGPDSSGAQQFSAQLDGQPLPPPPPPAAAQQAGRVYLTATAELDDAGREALWAAYIADKELLVEMLGDTDYQDWFDEEVNPLPAHHTATLKGVEALLDAALGSPDRGGHGGSLGDPSSGAQALAAPDPRASPWQAALASCLQLLERCLDRVLAAATGSSGSEWPGGQAEQQQQWGREGAGPAVAAAARLLGAPLGEQQLAKAGHVALWLAVPDYGANTAALAMKGACSHAVGGALLHFALQLLQVVQQGGGAHAVPVQPTQLSAFAALLGRLLPLAQQERQGLAESALGDAKKLGKPPLQLLPPIGLRLLQADCLRPAVLSRDSVACLLQLAYPTEEPQEALAQSAALLWGLLARAPPGDRHGSPSGPPPEWLDLAPCSLPRQVLLRRGVARQVQAAAAEQLLGQLEQGLDRWEAEGGLAALAEALAVASRGPPAANGARQQRKGKSSRRGGAPAAAEGAAADGGASSNGAEPSSRRRGSRGGWQGPEVLLPAIDACCTAVQWLAQRQQHEQQEEEEQASEGVALVGPLGTLPALKHLLRLARRLAAICTSALQHLDSYMGSLLAGGGACPAAVGQAATLWALSLEMASCLEEGDSICWPQALAPLQQQLSTALAGLAEAQQSCAELWRGLPEAHPASAAILAAMEDAPSLWGFSSTSADDAAAAESSGGGAAAAWDSLGNDGSGGGANAGKKGAGAEGGGGGVGQRRRRKRLADVKNPFLRACIAEDGCHADDLAGDDLSDLEDFIVFNPSRDYDRFLADHFPTARSEEGGSQSEGSGSDSESGREGESEREEGGQPCGSREQNNGEPPSSSGRDGGGKPGFNAGGGEAAAAEQDPEGTQLGPTAGAAASAAAAAASAPAPVPSPDDTRPARRRPKGRAKQRATADGAALAPVPAAGKSKGRGRPKGSTKQRKRAAAVAAAAAAVATTAAAGGGRSRQRWRDGEEDKPAAPSQPSEVGPHANGGALWQQEQLPVAPSQPAAAAEGGECLHEASGSRAQGEPGDAERRDEPSSGGGAQQGASAALGLAGAATAAALLQAASAAGGGQGAVQAEPPGEVVSRRAGRRPRPQRK